MVNSTTQTDLNVSPNIRRIENVPNVATLLSAIATRIMRSGFWTGDRASLGGVAVVDISGEKDRVILERGLSQRE